MFEHVRYGRPGNHQGDLIELGSGNNRCMATPRMPDNRYVVRIEGYQRRLDGAVSEGYERTGHILKILRERFAGKQVETVKFTGIGTGAVQRKIHGQNGVTGTCNLDAGIGERAPVFEALETVQKQHYRQLIHGMRRGVQIVGYGQALRRGNGARVFLY